MLMGHKGVHMFRKGIRFIHHTQDSQDQFFSFSVVKARFNLGIPFKIPWNLLCVHVFQLNVLLTTNLNVLLTTKNWWTATCKDFYTMRITAPQLTERKIPCL